MVNTKPNPVREKSFRFAVRIVNFGKYLMEWREFILSKQIIRSGTSIGANIREAQQAQSPADFIHKMSIAQKEADETLYWLELLKETEYIDDVQFISLETELLEVVKLLCAILKTSKSRN